MAAFPAELVLLATAVPFLAEAAASRTSSKELPASGATAVDSQVVAVEWEAPEGWALADSMVAEVAAVSPVVGTATGTIPSEV